MKKQLILVIIISMVNVSFGQFWQGTGNPPCPGPQCMTATTNFLGTDASNNLKIKLGTGGIPHFQLEDNTLSGNASFFDNTPPPLYVARARVNIYQSTGRANLHLTTGTRTSFDEGLIMYYENLTDKAYLGNLTLKPGANLDLGAGWNGVPGSEPVRADL